MEFWNKISPKIRHVQSLPERQKNRVIWILAIAMTVLIGVVWSIFFMKYENAPKGGNSNNSLWGDIKNNFKNKVSGGFYNLRDNYLPGAKKIIEEEKAKNNTENNTESNK